MEIPPVSWGAVEILIWDLSETLKKAGHEVLIVNTPNKYEIVHQTNSFAPDFVHIHYDEYFDVDKFISCPNRAITSHYGYIEQFNRYDPGYTRIFNGFLQLPTTKIFALSPGIASVYSQCGFDNKRIFTVPNGVRCDLFNFKKECPNPESSIYLAKIEPRKRQFLFHGIRNLYFAGRICDFRYNGSNHLGEWSKQHLYDHLTDYANLVLLSDGEAHPLVCLEALSAGLGLVISEFAAANLDQSLPFIDVIPESKIGDSNYISDILDKNRRISIQMRDDIREYAASFSWEKIVENYYLPSI